jgi:tRNA (guanine-N7-)-methyltransferase
MHPPVRSFRRRGRMTPGRRLRYAEFAPKFVIEPDDIAAWQPTIVDIGFGGGESVVATATNRPDERILGVEVHEAGITHLLTDLAAADITNVRVVRSDILEVLHLLPNGSLREVCIFFPDPWPKIAHAHRRLVRGDVVRALAERLADGGLLCLATDADHYAEQMREVCRSEPLLAETLAPDRVTTKYEQRGRAAGRAIVDLAYRKGQTGEA